MSEGEQASPEFLTLEEVSKLLKLSPKAIRSRVNRRTLPAVRTPTGRCFSPLRFNTAELRAWLAPKPATAAPSPELTVTIDDRPAEDIAAVVRGEPVSNRLILYVRLVLADNRAADRADRCEIPSTRKSITREVFEACLLEDHEAHFAHVIAEAAGWDHLAGEVVP